MSETGDKFKEAFEKARDFEFGKFSFERPTYDMLVIKDEDEFLLHLQMQSAGLAYFGALMKKTERAFDEYENKSEARKLQIYAECSRSLSMGGKKPTVNDIKAEMNARYEAELDAMQARLDALREEKDYVSTFYKAWEQKAFQLNAMSRMITAGLLSPSGAVSPDAYEDESIARGILERRHKD